jgi:hypothetical protein
VVHGYIELAVLGTEGMYLSHGDPTSSGLRQKELSSVWVVEFAQLATQFARESEGEFIANPALSVLLVTRASAPR